MFEPTAAKKKRNGKKLALASWTLVCSLLAAAHSATAQGLNFSASTYPAGSGPYVGVGDINGDGLLDVITANFNTNTLTVLTNNGSGGFGFYSTLTVGNSPDFVAVVDANGDGTPDIICSNFKDDTLSVLTNNGSGGYGSNATLKVGTEPQNFAVADVNGDGRLDLVCVNYSNPGTLTVLTNNGSGGFVFSATLTAGDDLNTICAADINGDGYVDLITVSYKGTHANTMVILTNNGSGIFVSNATYSVGKGPIWVAAADVNGDGKPDLICANNLTNTLTILTNNGIGVFGFNATFVLGGFPEFVTAADVNGDGYVDLITANGGTYVGTYPGTGNSIEVLTNNGRGVFGFNATLTTGNGPDYVWAADMNGDGKLDLITSNFGDDTVTVLMNDLVFPSPVSFPTPTINQQGGRVRVAWPSFSPGWSLQETPDLRAANWFPSGCDNHGVGVNGVALVSTIADDGTNKSLTISSVAGPLFFRLTHP